MMNEEESIIWNRQHAYAESLGSKREAFCKDFIEKKSGIVREMEEGQRKDAGSVHASITCKKHCEVSSCCMEYIESSIQECEAIIYFLYNHPESLSRFLQNFPRWRKKVSANGDLHNEVDKFYKALFSPDVKIKHKSVLHAMDAQYFDLHIKYLDFQIPCPFLSDNECIIYDVRPFACVGSYSTSPVKLCIADARILPPVNRTELPPEAGDSSFYFGDLGAQPPLFMPLNVYEILFKGYKHVADVMGLKQLEKEAKTLNLILDV